MSRRWRTLALVLVTLGVIAWAIGQFPQSAPRNLLTDPASVERTLLADQPGGALSLAIKRTFPEDFEALKRAVVERARTGGTPQEIQQVAGAFVSEATRNRRASLVQAPVPDLRAYLATEIALVEQLAATSPERCAAYFADPLDDAGWFAPDLRDLYLRQNIALWQAAAGARDHPAGRTLAAPSPRPVSCTEGLDARKKAAALPDAQFGQVYPAML